MINSLSHMNSQAKEAQELVIADTSPLTVLHTPKSFGKVQNPQLRRYISGPDSIANSNEIESNINYSVYRPDTTAWLSLAACGLVAMCMLAAFRNSAKSLSRWGKNNPLKARAIIGAAHLVTGTACIVVGDHLYDLGIIVPDYARLASAGLFASAVIFYPNRYLENGACAFSYLERKFYDVGLFTIGATMMLYVANHYDITTLPTYPVQTAAFSYVPAQNIATVSIAQKEIALSKREFKQTIHPKFDDIKRDRTRRGKTVATILVILGFIALTFGVAALSCTIACAGAEPAAIAVFIGGSALIIAGLVKAIRAIHKSPKNAVIAPDQPQT